MWNPLILAVPFTPEYGLLAFQRPNTVNSDKQDFTFTLKVTDIGLSQTLIFAVM